MPLLLSTRPDSRAIADHQGPPRIEMQVHLLNSKEEELGRFKNLNEAKRMTGIYGSSTALTSSILDISTVFSSPRTVLWTIIHQIDHSTNRFYCPV